MKAFKYILLAGILATSLIACKPEEREKTQDEIESTWPAQISTMEVGDFVLVSRDTTGFIMGSNILTPSSPEHQVYFSKSFYMCTTEVTQAQWNAIMGTNPSDNEGLIKEGTNADNCPVNNITLEDAKEFVEKLNAISNRKFAIPTEAQWEWAAIGGKLSNGYLFSGSNTLSEVAWTASNSEGYLNEVGKLKANELGLYDMTGNVEEWTADKYANFTDKVQTDPIGSKTGTFYATRGGHCYDTSDEILNVKSRIKTKGTEKSYIRGLRLILEEPLSTDIAQ